MSRKAATQCAEVREKRGKGMRYVYWRGRCKNRTTNPSGYCWQHNYSWRQRG